MQSRRLNKCSGASLAGTLFVSGWGGYDFLFPNLSKQTRFILPFDPAEITALKSLLSRKWDLVIGWSLGAHLCLKNINVIRADRLVLVSPFLDFCRGSSREKVLKMISGMDKDPERTMRWFWKLCGIRNPPQRFIHEHHKLKLCLNFLCQSRVNPEQIESELPVILIHGLKDKIVPIKASEIILEYLPNACYHPLPFGHFIPEEEIIKAVYGQSD